MTEEIIIDYKTKCELLAADNVKLTTEKASLEQVCEKLKTEVEKWKNQHDQTVAVHNDLKDQLIQALANAKFMTSAQIIQQQQQTEQIKAQLMNQQQQGSK